MADIGAFRQVLEQRIAYETRRKKFDKKLCYRILVKVSAELSKRAERMKSGSKRFSIQVLVNQINHALRKTTNVSECGNLGFESYFYMTDERLMREATSVLEMLKSSTDTNKMIRFKWI